MKYTVLAVGRDPRRRSPTTSSTTRRCSPARRGSSWSRCATTTAGRAPDPAARYRVLLDSRGRTYDSVAFARWLEDRRQGGRDVCFVIGGAVGIELERCDERLSFGPMTFPHQLARVMLRGAALPRAQDPRRRAVPSLARDDSPRRPQDRRAQPPPASCATAAARGDRLSLERPKKAGFGDYSTNAAMLLAPALGEPPRAVAERLGAALQERLGRPRREGRGRRPGLPQPVPGRRLVPGGGRRRARRRRRVRARRASGRADPGRVRLRQPDRPADRGVRPPRRVRRRARADPRAVAATRSSASTTSTTAAARSSGSASRSWPARAARSRPRTATRASTSPSSPTQIPDAAPSRRRARGRRRRAS